MDKHLPLIYFFLCMKTDQSTVAWLPLHQLVVSVCCFMCVPVIELSVVECTCDERTWRINGGQSRWWWHVLSCPYHACTAAGPRGKNSFKAHHNMGQGNMSMTDEQSNTNDDMYQNMFATIWICRHPASAVSPTLMTFSFDQNLMTFSFDQHGYDANLKVLALALLRVSGCGLKRR